MRVPTCSRSRTWPDCFARQQPPSRSQRCAYGSTSRPPCTHARHRRVTGATRPPATAAGVNAVDVAIAAMAGTTSQPSTSAAAVRVLERPAKVTPSSKVDGDLALHLVAQGAHPDAFEADPEDVELPASVVRFRSGALGVPPGEWPEPFRTRALAGRVLSPGVAPLTDQDERDLAGGSESRRDRLYHLLFPGRTKDYQRSRTSFGHVSVLSTILPPPRDEPRRGDRDRARANGRLRLVQVRGRGIDVDVFASEEADPGAPRPHRCAVRRSGDTCRRGRAGGPGRSGRRAGRGHEDGRDHHDLGRGRAQRAAIGAVQQLEGGDVVMVIGRACGDAHRNIPARWRTVRTWRQT